MNIFVIHIYYKNITESRSRSRKFFQVLVSRLGLEFFPSLGLLTTSLQGRSGGMLPRKVFENLVAIYIMYCNCKLQL